MKRFLAAVLAVLMLIAVSAMAEGQHVDGTVEWKLDLQRTYEPGTVIVKRNDGEMEETTIAALVELNNANEIRFEALYKGAEVAVVTLVEKINGRTEYNGHMMKYGYVETDDKASGSDTTPFAYFLIQAPTEEAVIYLNPGDQIVATGKIWSGFGFGINLYCANGDVTTIEPYDQYMEWAKMETVEPEETEPELSDEQRLAEYTDQDTVQKLQQALNDAGYECGSPDGVAGKKTQSAISGYQEAAGLTVTGTATYELLLNLGILD